MDFMFEIQVARMTTAEPSGTTIAPVQTWYYMSHHIRCDVNPLSDDLLFMQSGADTVATHIVHCFADTDIQPKDRITILSSKRLAGPVGQWFLITAVVRPTETIAFVRAHAVSSDKPPGLT
jgi:hypothetical protein